jgi:hypothetical protein
MKSFTVRCIIALKDHYDDSGADLLLERILETVKNNNDIIDYGLIDCEEILFDD